MNIKGTGSYYTTISFKSQIFILTANFISLGELCVFFFVIISTIYQLNNCVFNQNNVATFYQRLDKT